MIDAHAHLIDSKIDAENIINNMASDKLDMIINIGTCVKDSKKGVKLAAENENIYTTVGIHPEYASSVTEQKLQTIDELASRDKVVAIGEIGLDYHYEITEEIVEKQKQIFIEQIKIAHKHGLPVVIHCRDAADDVIKILKDNKQFLTNGFCMHCYSEGSRYYQTFKDMGSYFSFTGNITYKKTDRSYLKNLDKDKIMVETDSPYLAPEPLRGTINAPKNVWITAQKVADELEMSLTDFNNLVTKNIKTFYRIK